MLTVASRPADEGHPYGHYKAEYFASAFEGLLILAAAAAIAWAALPRLAQPQPVALAGWGLALSIGSLFEKLRRTIFGATWRTIKSNAVPVRLQLIICAAFFQVFSVGLKMKTTF